MAIRVLGCLIEKEFTTPDIYPLSLNSLVNACNQRSNRNPVMDAGAREVEAALETLRFARLASVVAQADARVMKFKHTLAEVYFMELSARAVLAELLLRGAQTTAELRLRAARMHDQPALEEVEQLLLTLAAPETGTLVRKLPRLPGQKEPRWMHLLAGEPDTTSPATTTAMAPEPAEPTVEEAVTPRLVAPAATATSLPGEPALAARVATLESQVAQLRQELSALRESLGA